MLITAALKDEIEYIIANIEHEYQRTKGLILTEGDLKCLIYSKLEAHFLPQVYGLGRGCMSGNTTNNELTWRMKTLDQHIYASPVHTEIPWYDENHRLAIRPDITILEPNKLSILHGYDGPSLPSKQCAFGGQGIIFELKFIRKKKGIDNDSLENIKKDFGKIERLSDKLRAQGVVANMFCYFVIFNKTNYVCDEFREFMQENRVGHWHKVIYASGDVTF